LGLEYYNVKGVIEVFCTKKISSKVIPVSYLSIEQLYLSINYFNEKYIVGDVYLLHSSSVQSYVIYSKIFKNLVNGSETQSSFLCGDFHLPNIKCSNDNSGISYSITTGDRTLFQKSLVCITPPALTVRTKKVTNLLSKHFSSVYLIGYSSLI